MESIQAEFHRKLAEILVESIGRQQLEPGVYFHKDHFLKVWSLIKVRGNNLQQKMIKCLRKVFLFMQVFLS
jgi:hypothetical protein